METSTAGLKFTLNLLTLEQKRSIYREIFSNPIPGTSQFFEPKLAEELVNKIYEFISEFTKSELKTKTAVEDLEIIDLWKDFMLHILLKRAIPKEWKAKRDLVLSELAILGSVIKDASELDNKLEAISRDMLFLLFESLGEKEKGDFLDKVREEAAKKYKVQLTKDDLNKAVIEAILSSTASASVVAVPIVATVALGFLSNGFLVTVILPGVLGFFGINLAAISGVLAAAAGPVGWGIAGSVILGSVFFAGSKFQKQKSKVGFVQAIFSIYSYKLQNRFSQLVGY